MKKIIQHEIYGEICYFESEWTGRKRLTINGRELQKDSKKTFLYIKDGKTISFEHKGSFFSGVSIFIENEKIEITKPCKWYEFVLAIIPFAFVIIWGNIPVSVNIFPVVGGAIGGGITGLLGAYGLSISSRMQKWYLKVLVGVITAVISILICYLVALAILSA